MLKTKNKVLPSGTVFAVWAIIALLFTTLLTGDVLHSSVILFSFIIFEYLHWYRDKKGKTAIADFPLYLLLGIAVQLIAPDFGIFGTFVGLYISRFIYRHIQEHDGTLSLRGVLNIAIPFTVVVVLESISCQNFMWFYNMLSTPMALSVIPHLCLLLEVLTFYLFWLLLRSLCRAPMILIGTFLTFALAVATVLTVMLHLSWLLLLTASVIFVAIFVVFFCLKGVIGVLFSNPVMQFNRALLCFAGFFGCVCVIVTLTAFLATCTPVMNGTLIAFLYSLIH